MKKIKLFGENGILNGKRTFILTCAAALLITGTTVSLAASGNIKSQGRIIFDNKTSDTSDDVIFDASDLTTLENKISEATTSATTGKEEIINVIIDKYPGDETPDLTTESTFTDIADYINSIGADANVTESQLLAGVKAYNGTETITGTMVDNGTVTSTPLNAGETYTIPEGYHSGLGIVTTNDLASQTSVTGTYINDHDTDDTSDDTEDNLVAATADNLSLGTAAWVDGQYIVGTGGDNNSYYTQGYANGVAGAMDNVDITYHLHSDSCYSTCVVEVTYSYIGTYDGTIHATQYERHYNCPLKEQGRINKGTKYPPSTDSYNTQHEFMSCGKTEESIETITFK